MASSSGPEPEHSDCSCACALAAQAIIWNSLLDRLRGRRYLDKEQGGTGADHGDQQQKREEYTYPSHNLFPWHEPKVVISSRRIAGMLISSGQPPALPPTPAMVISFDHGENAATTAKK